MSKRPPDDFDAAIKLGQRERDPGATRWDMLLQVFMRVAAALWMLQGLMQWRGLLLAGALDQMTPSRIVATIFFAIFDLMAAVGLWLAAPWGGALWLIVVFTQMSAAIALPGFFPGGLLVIPLNIILVLLYLLLTFETGKEPDRAGAVQRASTRAWRHLARWRSEG
ncbi:MAG: hypothetical protein KGL46_13765 [Hyphomicrobiales bacterium]|nr:hypothetical protein [Hyphomicrobiales bacterium]